MRARRLICSGFTTNILLGLVCLGPLLSAINMASASYESGHFDPYSTLGVSRGASNKDVRRAYKSLARRWHPDKNKSPKAQDVFMKITEAYDILSDEERRYNYDNYGTTSEQKPNAHQQRGFNNPFGFYSDMPFSHSFFSNSGHKNIQILTNRLYENTVLSLSHRVPQLIYVYGDWCFQCMQLEMIWESVADDLKSLGVGVYEMNYQDSRTLNSKLGVVNYPQFLIVINGKIVKYNYNEFSAQKIRKFVASVLPKDLIKAIYPDTYINFFRDSFIANKPQVILFSNKDKCPLLFQLVANEYRDYLAFAYVHSHGKFNGPLRKKFGVDEGEQVLVLLKEEPSSPEEIIKGSNLNKKSLRRAVSENRFFHLPRISSQKVFDEICPVTSDYDRQLCVVLFTTSSQDHSYQRYLLRKMAKESYWKERHVRFMYINEDVQWHFNMKESRDLEPCKDREKALKVMVLWRHTKTAILYEWLRNGLCTSDHDNSVIELESMLGKIINKEMSLVRQANISSFIDENRPHIFLRLYDQFIAFLDHIVNSYQFFSWSSPTSLTINALFLSIIFLVGVILPLASGKSSEKPMDSQNWTVLGIVKLSTSNYKKLINNAQAGKFTVVLLVDAESVNQVEESPIMQAFSDVTSRFLRGGVMTFAWLSIQEQLSWCTEVMDVKKFGDLMPGTIIALNGHRKYIHIFKPKGNIKEEMLADFIGLESDTELDEDEDEIQARRNKMLAIKSMQKFLSIWLERLCDGSLSDRVKVDNWPTMEQ